MISVIKKQLAVPLFWLSIFTVFIVCLIPIHGQGPINHFDKLVHMASFAIVTLLCFYAYPSKYHLRRAIQAIALIGFGLLIEIAQSFTGYRFFSWLDLLADGLGVISIWLIYLGYYSRTTSEDINDITRNS